MVINGNELHVFFIFWVAAIFTKIQSKTVFFYLSFVMGIRRYLKNPLNLLSVPADDCVSGPNFETKYWRISLALRLLQLIRRS